MGTPRVTKVKSAREKSARPLRVHQRDLFKTIDEDGQVEEAGAGQEDARSINRLSNETSQERLVLV